VHRFAYIGSPAACYSSCSAQSGPQGVSSPNNNAEADGMASIIAHELAESASDPLINAWCAHVHARQSSSVTSCRSEKGCLRLKHAILSSNLQNNNYCN
jgi:hypothetical protein